MHLIDVLLRVINSGGDMHKKTEVLCLSRNPVYAASERKYTAAGGEVQESWGGVHE